MPIEAEADFKPTMVMHPIRPDVDGKDLTEYRDPAGKQLFVDLAKVARSQGSGFVPYLWPKHDQSTPLRNERYSLTKGVIYRP